MHIKFIHAADLHLGSPFSGLSKINPGLREEMINASFSAFHNLIDSAIKYKVDFLLIAGDSFDSGSGDLRAQYIFNQGMKKLRECEIAVYLICGNHDPLGDWSTSFKLPENVYRFGGEKPESIVFHKNSVPASIIAGMSYKKREETRNLAALYPKGDTDLLSLALLHGDFGTDSGHMPYNPFNMVDLQDREMDYWALGHIHKRQILSEENPTVIFPGNIQGRHFNEEGEKGCYLVEFNGKKLLKLEFIPLSPIVFKRVGVDCSGMEDLDTFTEGLEELGSQLMIDHPGQSLVVRPTLSGSTALYKKFQDESQLKGLFDSINLVYRDRRPFVLFERPHNRTLPEIDLEERKQADDFFAELLREFDDLMANPEHLQKLVAKIDGELKGVNRRYTREFSADFIKELSELAEEAQTLAVNAVLINKARNNDD